MYLNISELLEECICHYAYTDVQYNTIPNLFGGWDPKCKVSRSIAPLEQTELKVLLKYPTVNVQSLDLNPQNSSS